MESAVDELCAILRPTPPPPGALTLGEVKRALAARRRQQEPDLVLEREVEEHRTRAGRARALEQIAYTYMRDKKYDLAVERIEAAHKLSPRVVTRASVERVHHVAEVVGALGRLGANRIVDEELVRGFFDDTPEARSVPLLDLAVDLLAAGEPDEYWTRSR
jgi:hypothetical protein